MIKSVTAAGLVVSVSAVALLAAPPASAAATSTVAVTSGVSVDFRAAAGQRNDVRASYLGASTAGDRAILRFAVSDNHPIRPGAGCVSAPAAGASNRAVCTVTTAATDPSAGVRIHLGDGADRATATLGPQGVEIDGGTGNDRLRSTGLGYLYGRAGNDTLTGGTFADGGDGNDTIRLGNRADGVTEGKAVGGRGNDVIHGGTAPDTVFGNSGRDRIYGGRGGDELLGGPDNDVVFGNSGNDGVYGGPGRDRLSGGPGTNTVRQDGEPRQGDQPNP